MGGNPTFDRCALLERLGDDSALLEEVLWLFLDEAPKVLIELDRAVADRNSPQVRMSAHKMRGALLSISAQRAADLACRLEDLGQQVDCGGYDAALALLKQEFERLEQELGHHVPQGKLGRI